MKYKIAGIALLLLAIAAAILAPLLTKEDSLRYHQHISAKLRPEDEVDDGTFNTHLPLVLIDTGGEDIPGKPIFDEDGKVTGYTTTKDGQENLVANIKIIDNNDVCNRVDDMPKLETLSNIHIRGRSSRAYDKKQYSLEFIEEDGGNNNVKVMGMAKHHEWVLNGPYMDKTMIRNYMWYNIAGEIMEYAPNVRFCEVFLNGEYQGLYVMTEKITSGKSGGRLNLNVRKKQEEFLGYLLCLDEPTGDELKDLNNFTAYTYRAKETVSIQYPGAKNLTPELAREIEDDFSAFEKTLYSYDFDDNNYGYRSMIDVDSFVDYFLINEFTVNYDAGWLSTYIYKDQSKKYKMCIWDYNSSCDNYQKSQTNPQRIEMQGALWFNMLVKDEAFTRAIVDRYHELRKKQLSEEYLENYVDEVVEYLGPAIDRNYEKWGYVLDKNFLLPVERNPHTYEDAVDDLKEFLRLRGNWLDKNIETVYQYSAESRKKKFIEDAN